MSGWPRPGGWDPVGDLQREVGRLLQNLEPLRGGRSPRPFPALNFLDAGDRFLLIAELPGVAPEEIEIALTGDVLEFRGERRRPEGVSDDRYRRQERPFGSWSRSVTLPDRVDPAAVTALCEHGILTITLPKAAETRPRYIAVGAPNGAEPRSDSESKSANPS